MEVAGDIAKVALEVSEKCGRCGTKVMCHPEGSNKMYIEAINGAGAKVGDKVRIEVAPGTSVLAAFLLFIVPIIAFIVVFTVGRILTKNENFAITGGFGGLILFFLFLVRINRKAAKTRKFHPVVKEVME